MVEERRKEGNLAVLFVPSRRRLSHSQSFSLSPLWTLTTTLVATSCQSAMVSWLLSMYRWKWVTLSVAATRA